MAVMTNEQRRDAWRAFMDDVSRRREPCGVTKADLRAAFDALDDWFDANAATLNQAIPQPARGALTAAQKAQILALVIRKRYDTGA